MKLCCHGRWAGRWAWEHKASSCFPGLGQVSICSSFDHSSSTLSPSEVLPYESLKAIVFFSLFDQRPPGSAPAVLLGYQPAPTLTGALCLQQVLSAHCFGAAGRGHMPTFIGKAKTLHSETWLGSYRPNLGRGLEGKRSYRLVGPQENISMAGLAATGDSLRVGTSPLLSFCGILGSPLSCQEKGDGR